MQTAPSIVHIRRTLKANAGELSRRKVRALSVFGSVARHEATPDSDLDMLVEFDEARNPTVFDLIGLEQYLEDLFGLDVDVVEPDGLKPVVRTRAERDAVQVF